MDGQPIETSRGQIKPITIGANPLVKFIHDNTPMTFKAAAEELEGWENGGQVRDNHTSDEKR